MRARGFLEWAEDYIGSNPGLTAQDIARKCLDLGIVMSTAQNPEASLVATLHKHYTDRNIFRRKEFGAYRFYPSDTEIPIPDSMPVKASSDRITPDQLQRLISLADDLVDVGKFESQADALVWLIQKQ